MKKPRFELNNKKTFIIAEISANHSQKLNNAVKLIKKAKACDADGVKFQAYTPDTLTIDADNKYFRIKHPKWGGQTLYQLYKKAYTPWSWFKTLKKISEDLGLIFFSTAFDKTSVDFLEELDVSVHKISSFELVDLPLIEYIAKTKKPLMLSTGMATFLEIKEAVDAAREAGAKNVMLLKCVSSYPAKAEDMNLITINDMAERFKLPIGLSDHTLGITASLAGVCLGARIIEKHFTLSRALKTPDSFFSVEPAELKLLVENVRATEKLIGKIHYGMTKEEESSRVFRRSLFAVGNIRKGETLTSKNIMSIRPAGGIAPKYLKKILGKSAGKDIKRGTPLNWNLLAK